MTLALQLATAILIAVTLLPSWRNPHWLVRGFDFPRLQLATFAALLLLVHLVRLDMRGPLQEPSSIGLAAATALCLFWHAWWIAPYSRLWPIEVPDADDDRPDRRIRILTANVLMSNHNVEALIALVREREPDVLVTLESNQWWQDRLEVLEEEMPHVIQCPLDNLYGMHVYSRLPLKEAEISFLVEDDKPSMHTLVTLRSGDDVCMHFLHPAPPSPTEDTESAERDAELVVVARSVATSRFPIIVTGDLNDVAWSSTTRLFRKLGGLLDPRIGRGMFNTFHTDYPFLRWPLDHVFHSGHFRLVSIERLAPIGSDHFPLLAELSYATATVGVEDRPNADTGDRAWARSIVADQPVGMADVPRPAE